MLRKLVLTIDAPTEIYEIQDCQYFGVMDICINKLADWGKSLEENIILPNQSLKICTTYVQSSPIYQPLFCNNSIKTILFKIYVIYVQEIDILQPYRHKCHIDI